MLIIENKQDPCKTHIIVENFEGNITISSDADALLTLYKDSEDGPPF